MRRTAARLFFFCGVALAGLPSCKAGTQLRGQIAGVRELADAAEEHGAMKCAPRELALARAHLEFAEIALAEGSQLHARAHLDTAEVNAKAALLQAPAQYCSEEARSLPAAPGDRDGDGYLDPTDSCPDVAETFNGFQDADGCADDPDSDGDGLTDSTDACPILAEDRDEYLDGDGCPEPDNDLDGLPDLDDECPNTPGQKEEAPKGCPVKPALVVVTDCEVKITQQIHFETGRDVIRAESFPILDAVAEVLAMNSGIRLQIQGHTDDVGSNKANLDLSERRAASVRKYLVSHGADVGRLESRGFGEEVPLVENNSKDNRALNRRVQFMRTEGQKAGCGEAKTPTESASSPGAVAAPR